MPKLRFIGDIHGNKKQHLKLAQEADYSIQVGDLGFNYDYLSDIDSSKHRFIGGNHDNYDCINDYPHNLGDFGVYEVNNLKIFFIRGAFSIDRKVRIKNRWPWYEAEELSYRQGMACIALYEEVCKDLDIVVTHECPFEIAKIIGNPEVLHAFGHSSPLSTRTNQLLQTVYDIYQPKVWIFGHFHKRWQEKNGNTQFVCLEEFGTYDVDAGKRTEYTN